MVHYDATADVYEAFADDTYSLHLGCYDTAWEARLAIKRHHAGN